MKRHHGFKIGAVSALSLAIALGHQTAFAQNDKPRAAIEEVTVTAQRRSERSLDVPISITALSADQLGKGDVQSLGDIGKLTPGVRFDNLGGNSQPTIRGVGSAVVVAGAGSNVAIYTDGFYSPNPLVADSSLLNIDSIQVLKGPQGTLFGRNSTAGAILVSTSEPSTETQGKVEASYGSYNAQRYNAYATTGITEDLAVDVAGLISKGDGFLDNIVTGSDKDGKYDDWALRFGTRWQATDLTSVLFRYSRSETDNPTSDAYGAFEKDGTVFSPAAGFVPVAHEPHEVSNGFTPAFTSKAEAYQLTVKTELEFATLTSYTQYRDESATHYYDFDLTALDSFHYIFTTTDEIFTQEFLLSSNGDSALQWTAGLFYFEDETEYPRNLVSTGGPFFRSGGSGVTAKSLAVFGDMTYSVTDNLYVTVGGRYSKDKITDAYSLDNTATVQTDYDNLNENAFTPRISVRYEPNENSSIYASYSEGFKSGILNVAGDGSEVDSETLKAYEVGYKYRNGSLMLDMSTFYYDYTDLQVAGYIGTTSFIENAADSTVYGIEGNTRYAFTDTLTASLGVAYIDAEYDTFTDSQVWIPSPTGYIPGFEDASGNQMQRSPELTATLGINYETYLADGLLSASGTLYHTSDFYFDSSNAYQQDSYQLLSLYASWTDPSETYTFAVFGDNLTDEEYRAQVLPQQVGVLSTWGAPRTFGASVAVNF